MGRRSYRQRTWSRRSTATSTAKPKIREFFDGSTILITGGSGLVGKMLLQKILNSCYGVKKVFVVLRAYLDTPAERLSKILKGPLFEQVRLRTKNCLGRVVPVCGELLDVDLGISDEELEEILNSVEFVFHCATLLRFDCNFAAATMVNYLGTKNLMRMCHKMKKLKAVAYLSTAYSFCNLPVVDENTSSPVEDSLDEMCTLLDERRHQEFDTNCLTGCAKRPSIAHYSLALVEHYIRKNRGQLPFAIIRPSIITAALGEPLPGWIEGLQCINSILNAYGTGLLRSIYAIPDVYADWIPVDIVANTLITAAYYVALEEPEDVFIVNCTSSQVNPLTWGKVSDLCYPCILKYPNEELYRHPGRSFKSNYYAHKISVVLDHWCSGVINDLYERQIRVTSMYVGMQSLINYFEFYMTKKIVFSSTNMTTLLESMRRDDKREFCIDVRTIKWDKYIDNYIHGIRLYVIRESDSTLESSQMRLQRMRWKHVVSRVALAGIPVSLIAAGISYWTGSKIFPF